MSQVIYTSLVSTICADEPSRNCTVTVISNIDEPSARQALMCRHNCSQSTVTSCCTLSIRGNLIRSFFGNVLTSFCVNGSVSYATSSKLPSLSLRCIVLEASSWCVLRLVVIVALVAPFANSGGQEP
jgi:hypothetical protein